MKKFKINIQYQLKEGAWGGGNQFLKALKAQLQKQNQHTENLKEADVVIFNSHHSLLKIIRNKYHYPNKVFIHRLDGPLSIIRGHSLNLDKLIHQVNSKVANGTIFQSDWSRDKNIELGFNSRNIITIINNAPDPVIFNLKNKINILKDQKIKIISTSWSKNINKGFDFLLWIDKNLDFNKYEVVFVGNSASKFKNIKTIKALNSKELANELKKNHIFFAGSKNDPCSNSLIEALHCGLVVLAYNDGGHPELVKSRGELFKENEEIPQKLEKIVANYNAYQRKSNLPSISKIAEKYIGFAAKVLENYRESPRKKINFWECFLLCLNVVIIFLVNRINIFVNTRIIK